MGHFSQRVMLGFGCLLLTACLGASAEERIWTDKTGKFQLSAELVDVTDGNARLKRPDGRIVKVPVDRLSEADQEHLRDIEGEGAKQEKPLKAGDKVYLQVRGQWQLGVINKVLDGPGSARFEISLKTGARRSLKVAEKRLRRYGKAGDQGLLLPGDVVEILDTWKTKVVNTGVVVRVKGSRAYVVPEGELGEKSYWLSSLRAPGTGGESSLEGRVASAAESNRKPGAKPHPADQLTYPDPELTPVNFAAAQPIELAATGAPTTIAIKREPRSYDARAMRSLPLKLTPEKDAFWDKFTAANVAEDGSLGAALRTTGKKQSQLELIPLTKSRSKPQLFGLPSGTVAMELSPDGRMIATRRGETWGRNPKVDLWRVAWEDDTRKKISGFEHVISWAPVDEPAADSLEAARWLDDRRYLTLDDKKRLTLWEAETATPTRRITLNDNNRGKAEYAFIEGSDLLAIGQGGRGVVFLNLRTMAVEAAVGAGRVTGSQVSVSPSGALMIVTDANRVSQFWDLTAGQMLLETMLVHKASGTPTWSHEEGVILLGSQPIDIVSWKALPRRSLAKRSYDGVVWSVVEKKQPPLFGGVPALAPLTETGLRPNLEAEFSLAPGGGIALKVQTESAIAETTRRRFTTMIEDQGFRVDDASPFRLTLSTKVSTESQEYGQNASARSGDKGNFTVSYQVRSYSTVFSLDGNEILSNGGYQSPPVPRLFTNEAEVRQAAREPIPPDAALFGSLKLPQRVIRIE